MSDLARAAPGHMPFPGHRTCEQWMNPVSTIASYRRVEGAMNVSNFVEVEPRNKRIEHEREARLKRLASYRKRFGIA